jgi:uncharacterized membrane protein YccC
MTARLDDEPILSPLDALDRHAFRIRRLVSLHLLGLDMDSALERSFRYINIPSTLQPLIETVQALEDDLIAFIHARGGDMRTDYLQAKTFSMNDLVGSELRLWERQGSPQDQIEGLRGFLMEIIRTMRRQRALVALYDRQGASLSVAMDALPHGVDIGR